jgi:microcystin-dependent protein
MAQPYVGEIRMFAGNFAPAGWMFCGGQLLPISEYETLFQLIGTTYGGDGESTFGVPDLRGRLPIHQGGGFTIGETGGVETVTLTVAQMPAHNHPMLASQAAGANNDPSGQLTAQHPTMSLYAAIDPSVPLSPSVISIAGGNQPHSNIQPYLCVSFIISLFGIFPSQT